MWDQKTFQVSFDSSSLSVFKTREQEREGMRGVCYSNKRELNILNKRWKPTKVSKCVLAKTTSKTRVHSDIAYWLLQSDSYRILYKDFTQYTVNASIAHTDDSPHFKQQ